MVVIEQETRIALALSPRTVVMDKGRIVHDGRSRSLCDNSDVWRLSGVAE